MRKLTHFLAVGVLSIGTLACFNFFSPSCVGEGCGATATQVKGATTPSPTATPTATPVPAGTLNCRIDFMVFDSGPTELSVNQEGEFSLTPWQKDDSTGALVKVADSCNIPRAEFVVWSSNSPVGIVTKLPGGFAAKAKRVGIGAFTVTASLEGRTVSRVVN